MSRIYLSIIFYFFSQCVFAQNELKVYLEKGIEFFEKEDYYTALAYFEKSYSIDSNSVAICWKLAESYKKCNDYPSAARLYKKVYQKEETSLYPSSLLNWGIMEKQTGNYKEAVEIFKNAKKKYGKNKKDYNYLKSKRELESCLWANTALKDTIELIPVKLPDGINTENTEFGHTLLNKTLYFSGNKSDEWSKLHLFTSNLIDSISGDTKKVIPELNQEEMSSGNGTFSLDGSRYYFSKCDLSKNCKLFVSQKLGNKWSPPQELSDLINETNASTTQPQIANFEGIETLFFTSNKDGGEGLMDIYFCEIKQNGNQFGKVKKFSAANSVENELTPFYDSENKRMYFSSSWWDGFGGQDVVYSEWKNGNWSTPKNVGLPFNSPANDNYFFFATDTFFVSSNRSGSITNGGLTCCSDIYAFRTLPPPPIISKKETLSELMKRLPVQLYFHNDVPGPKNYEIVTPENYIETFEAYTAMVPTYKKEYSKGLSGNASADAEEDIENFFTEFVDKGVNDLQLFKAALLEELQKGFRIRLNIRGFASPLAKTDYNVALTKRRINSLYNYLLLCDENAFKPFLEKTATNGGQLEIVGVPFGEYTADKLITDNPNDQKNSVYSRAAALERKIEIQSVSYLDTDSLFFLVDIAPTSIVLGKIKSNDSILNCSLQILNNGNSPLKIRSIEIQDSVFSSNFPLEVLPKKLTEISFTKQKEFPKGFFSIPIILFFEGYEKGIKCTILGEGY